MEEPKTPPERDDWWARLRGGRLSPSSIALVVVLLGALGLVAGVVNWHYAINRWLFWRYAWVAFLAAAWALACLSCGLAILRRVGKRGGVGAWIEDRHLEAVLAFPLGVLAYQIAIFLLGLASLLGVVTFVLLPVAFLAAGRRPLLEIARRVRTELSPPRTFPELAVLLFGLGGLGVVYFQILSPETFHWDTRWYHLPIAQQYALQGAIRPFPEGWWPAAYPHAASLLYTWAFLLPRAMQFDKLELCVHMEFAVFVATIASIPTLVRALAPGVKARGTWAAMFLFPGIFLYDSNLAGAADHMAALWCIPIVLTLSRLWRAWDKREAALFGTFIGAAMVSKLSVWSMLIFPGVVFLARAGQLGVRRLVTRDASAPRVLKPFLVVVGMILLISTEHWLRNLVWYGDPMYPVFRKYFPSHPWSAESQTSLNLYISFASPPSPGWQGVRDALLAMFTFAFIPNDWPVFHRNVPVFGFLFTLSMFFAPFVRAGARLWTTYAGLLVTMVFWYLSTHQDRYLQVWLPVMVACTMATFGLVWQRRHVLVRGLLGALVALQIIWGGDVPFFPTHNLVNDSPIRLVSSFLASGFLRTPNRFRLYGDEGLVAEHLPPDAVLLAHESNTHIGFGVRTVTDQWQGRLSYAALVSPAAIYRELADMKVTHLSWEGRMSGWNSLGHDMAFLGFALNYGLDPVVLGNFTVARFPPTPPAGAFNDRVAVLACGSPYQNGMYSLGKLRIPEPGHPWATPDGPLPDVPTAIRDAGFLVVDPACASMLPPEVAQRFHPPMTLVRGPLRLYIRRL